MFWGSATTERSSASLRTAIYLLRRDLSPIGTDCLRADRHTVSLVRGCISIAPDSSITPSFLEELDLPLLDCEGFEDWLRHMRSGSNEEIPSNVDATTSGLRKRRSSHLALGFLASHQVDLSAGDVIRADSILDGIARSMRHMTAMDIHDLRGCNDLVMPLPVDSGLGATHLLQPVVERRGRSLAVHLRLFEASSRRVVWVSEPFDALSSKRDALVCSTSETLLQQMAESQADGDAVDLFPWTALTGLFSLDEDLIKRTEATVGALAADSKLPVFECLRLFSQVFKENEGVGRADVTSAEHICETISSIPDAHPMLPLSLSLAGYSAHMLLGDNELAETYISRASELAPNLALNLDHLAVIRLVKGDLEGSEAALQQCLRMGAASPWRYTYQVSGAMISMARGDARQALCFANQALMRKPRFIGALRYAMFGFALSDNAREAQRMQARIRRLRPDYDFEGWTDAMIRRNPPHLGARLAKGVQRAGLT